jgi:uncharacterized protein (DUF1330 family)
MPAYVIVDIEIQDPVGYEEYKKQAATAPKGAPGKKGKAGGD